MPDSGAEEVNLAVAAASKAFPVWSETPAQQRAAFLHKIADKIEERLEEFAWVSYISFEGRIYRVLT